MPFACRSEMGGSGGAAPAPPGLREYGTAATTGGDWAGDAALRAMTWAAGRGCAGATATGLLAGAFGGDAAAGLSGLAAPGAARAGSTRKGVTPGWPPFGGGFDPVTADYPQVLSA